MEDAARELALMGIDPARYGIAAAAPVGTPTRSPAPAPAPAPAGPRPVAPAQTRAVAADPWGFSALPALAPAPPRSAPEAPRRVTRAVSQGLVTAGATAVKDRECDLIAAVRARRQRPEVLAVLAGKGGVGTTTTAAGIGLTLAALRTDGVRFVDARRGTPSLGHRLSGRPVPDAAALLAALDAGRPSAPVAVRGLQIVDGAPWYAPVDRADLSRLLLDVGGPAGTTLLDVGNDTVDSAHFALGRSDRILVVTSAGPDALAACQMAFARAYQVDRRFVDGAVVAVVCPSLRAYRSVTRALRAKLGLTAGRIVPVPYDRRLAAGGPFTMDRLRPATREAYLRLAARLTRDQ